MEGPGSPLNFANAVRGEFSTSSAEVPARDSEIQANHVLMVSDERDGIATTRDATAFHGGSSLQDF